MKNIAKILIVLVVFLLGNTSFATKFCHIEYTIPIDYSKIDKNTLESQANLFFDYYSKIQSKDEKRLYIQPLLNRYSILSVMDPSEPFFYTRLGILYSDMGQDIEAKSNFYKATNLCPQYTYASYCFGNFYYDRGFYRKALAKFKMAEGISAPMSYDRFMKMGSIYEKLANYKEALAYYKLAYNEKQSEELNNKILLLEDSIKEYMLYD